jgi:polyhydroxyalkanoate synthesis regulator phasin
MVANGELTREEAGARYNAACGERGSERSEEDGQAIRRRLSAAVEAGELTREEAGEMLEGLLQRTAVTERQR